MNNTDRSENNRKLAVRNKLGFYQCFVRRNQI